MNLIYVIECPIINIMMFATVVHSMQWCRGKDEDRVGDG